MIKIYRVRNRRYKPEEQLNREKFKNVQINTLMYNFTILFLIRISKIIYWHLFPTYLYKFMAKSYKISGYLNVYKSQ